MPSHGHSCEEEHDHSEGPERGIQYNLYTKIDLDKVTCLNEAEEDSGKCVFKAWDQRLDKEKFVESDADPELLFNIPFTGNVKLKGIVVIGGEGDSHPSTMKLYKNRAQMSFDDVSAAADQEFELQPDTDGSLEYGVKIARFSSVSHLSIYFPKNFGIDNTKVYYIGLKGEFTEARREEIVICQYELAPNPAEHKQSQIEDTSTGIGPGA